MPKLRFYLLMLVALVFGAGLLIYVWQFCHGRNMLDPPRFDLSVYENPGWYKQQMTQAQKIISNAQSQMEKTEMEQKNNGSTATTQAN